MSLVRWLVPLWVFDGGYVADVVLVVCRFIDTHKVLTIVRHKHNGVPIFVVPRCVPLVYDNSRVIVWLIAGHSHCAYQGEEKYVYLFHASTSFRGVVGGLRCISA